MANAAFDAFIKRLRESRRYCDGHSSCYCPAHDDKMPRLDVLLVGNIINLRCFAGCKTEKIIEVMRLEMADLILSHESEAAVDNQVTEPVPAEPGLTKRDSVEALPEPAQRRPDGKYRGYAMIPNIIDGLQLSAGAFRLYAHIKHVTGEDGACWQGQRGLERSCRLSNRTIIKAKQELINAGLIECTLQMVNGHIGHVIKPLNIWDENEATAVNNNTRGVKEHARCKTAELRCKTAPDCGVKEHSIAVNNSTPKNTPMNNTPEENPSEENPGARSTLLKRANDKYTRGKYGHMVQR